MSITYKDAQDLCDQQKYHYLWETMGKLVDEVMDEAVTLAEDNDEARKTRLKVIGKHHGKFIDIVCVLDNLKHELWVNFKDK